MAYWIYKCNAKRRPHQRCWGDWDDLFSGKTAVRWGTTEHIPALQQAAAGDTVIAYQTDRRELVGVAKVLRLARRGQFLELILKPVSRVQASMPALKKKDARIAALPAFRPGWIATLYPISVPDAKHLLRTAERQPPKRNAKA